MAADVFCVCPTCEVTFPLSDEDAHSRSGMVRCISCRHIFAAEPNRIYLDKGNGHPEDENGEPASLGTEDRVHESVSDLDQEPESSSRSAGSDTTLSHSTDFSNENPDLGHRDHKNLHHGNQDHGSLKYEIPSQENHHESQEKETDAEEEAENLIQKIDEVADYLDRKEPDSRVVAEPEIQLLDLNMDRSIGVNPPKSRTAYDSGLELAMDDLDPLTDEFLDDDFLDDDSVVSPNVTSGHRHFDANGQGPNGQGPGGQVSSGQGTGGQGHESSKKRSKSRWGKNRSVDGAGLSVNSYEQTSLGRMKTNGVDEYIGKRSNPLATIVWSLVTVIFLFLLGVQVKYFFVEKYEQHETYRKYLVGFCKIAGCELSPRREPYSFTLTYTRIELHPKQPGSLRVTVKMVNEAQFAQPYPDLQLTLTDKVGVVVGRRIYSPDLYLPPDQENLIEPGSLREVMFDLLRPHETAVGFVVAVSVKDSSV
ncbi:MAG: DUF3426 domain-containing protein [Gammaproteobacteria bacterium]|nr:DUF3426 domain-containing protein [Gammaproteobacteria bacterium]NKB65105.1 DUF3426 domain-containing protein [Gammaproteobacteria bacterium]